ncbi:unnamed protein product [Nesidiocoris tenuis]|uniref:Uncharacterized protein n=1 Tax=Nesidiocoris tenuis TaxID=355587 RepID=A0A6H5H9Y0_9HEMI|nr:unnamed protein product [Nesidiocoris tenuis]
MAALWSCPLPPAPRNRRLATIDRRSRVANYRRENFPVLRKLSRLDDILVPALFPEIMYLPLEPILNEVKPSGPRGYPPGIGPRNGV